jgi:hypothetical protein
MRRLLFTAALTAAVGLGVAVSSGQAQSPYNHFGPYQNRYGYDRYGSSAQDRFHNHLEHREYDRQLRSREAHRYPMTPWQHQRLHDQLDHERYHDNLRDREFHDRYDRHDYHDHGQYHPGYQRRGIYIDPNHGVDINTGRFRFHFGR